MNILKFLQILAVALALAGYASWLRSARQAHPGPLMVGGILLYPTDQAEALWHEPTTRFVDVRSSVDYAYGHIAGALELPEDEFDQRLPGLRAQLEQARAIIVYCGSRRCARSLRVAMRLRAEGLEQTQIYPEGWNAWFERNLPVERSATR